MLKAVLFDLDHTLYDRYETMLLTLPETYKNLADYMCDGISYEKFRDEMIFADKEYNYSGWDKRTEYLIEKGIFNIGSDHRALRLKTYEDMMHKAVKYPFEDELFSFLRREGLFMGIVTNGELYIQQAKLDTLGYEKIFDLCYLCGRDGKQKPDTDPFVKAAELLGVAPSECVFVGDNPKNDIMGAKNAGMITVFVATCGAWRYDEYKRADFEIENVGELMKIMPEIRKFAK